MERETSICVGFVTYGAESNLAVRLQIAHEARYQVYVFDNSPEHELVREVCRRLDGIRYLTCGRNAGLGVGIASICAQAYYDGFGALVFFDQDTGFDRSTLDFIREFHSRKPEIAGTHSVVVFNGRQASNVYNSDRFAHRDVLLAISSGSLFFLENVRRIGWHNPTFFVDCVDYEFCLNSSNRGLLVGECSSAPMFDHETEQADYSVALLGHRRLRRYSWARVKDSLVASTRLLRSSVISRNGRFVYVISGYIVAYLWWQFVARVFRPPSESH